MTKNTGFRLELGQVPLVASSSSSFNELLRMYSVAHSLHAALASYFPDVLPSELEGTQLTSFFKAPNFSALFFPAAEDILAGRFLECVLSSGVLKVRHSKVNSSEESSGICGLSLEDKSAGEIVTVVGEPAIVSGFSGLDPGGIYYAYDDGTFTDSSPVSPVVGELYHLLPCGLGISSTAMKLVSPI